MNPDIIILLVIMLGNDYTYRADGDVGKITDHRSKATYDVLSENYERANMIIEMTRIPIDDVMKMKRIIYLGE